LCAGGGPAGARQKKKRLLSRGKKNFAAMVSWGREKRFRKPRREEKKGVFFQKKNTRGRPKRQQKEKSDPQKRESNERNVKKSLPAIRKVKDWGGESGWKKGPGEKKNKRFSN